MLLCSLALLGPREPALLAQETASDGADVVAQTPDKPSGNEGAEGTGGGTREERREAPRTKRKVHVNVSPVRAKISPTIEISLPSGNLSEHFEQSFNRLDMSFNLDYNFFDDSLKAGVAFAHQFKHLTPSIGFSENLDFENLVTPRIVGSKVVLAPTDKYISREKAVDLNLAYSFAKNLSATETFIVSDVYRGSLSSGTILDEGTDLTERIGLVYNSVEVRESERRVKFQGTYASSLLDFRYRNSFSNPISIGTQNSLLSHVIFGHGWNLQARLSANSPVKVFDKEKVGYYSLGGFDTIRGYPHGSLHAFRFAHLGTTWEREILREKELKFKLFRLQAVAHQFNLLFLLDGLALQDQLDVSSPVVFHSSLGAGFSFLVTGKEGGHLHVDLSLAQPLESGYSPVFYFRSSIFSFERKV
jgi:hypothetical protein